MPVSKNLDLSPAFEDFDGWVAGLPDHQRQAVEKRFSWTPADELQTERQRFLSVGLISQRTGHDVAYVDKNFETLFMPNYAMDERGLGMTRQPANVGEFFTGAKARFAREKEMVGAFNEGRMAAYGGKDIIPSLQEWQLKNGIDRLPDSTEFTKGFLDAKSALGDLPIREAAEAGQRYMDGAASEEDERAISEFQGKLLTLSKDQRRAALQSASMIAQANPIKKGRDAGMGALAGWGQEIGEGAARLFERFGGIASDEILLSASTLPMLPPVTDAAKSQYPVATGVAHTSIPLIDTPEKAAEFVREWKVSTFGTSATGVTLKDVQEVDRREKTIRQLSPEEIEAVRGALDTEKQKNQLMREWRSIMESSDPVGDVTGGIGTSLSLVGLALATRGRSLPLSWQLYADNNYDRIMLEDPDTNPAVAMQAARFSAAGEAALDLLEVKFLSKIPTVAAILKGGTKAAWWNAGLRLGGTVLFEQVQEGLQDLTLPVTQHILNALGKDIKGIDWTKEMKRFRETRLPVFLASLPIIFLGTGYATYRDIKDAQQILSNAENLAAVGVTNPKHQEPVLEAARSGNMELAESRFHEAWNLRNPQANDEAQQKAEQRESEVKAAFDEAVRIGLMPSIRQGKNGVTVTSHTGESVTFPKWADAQAAATMGMRDTERANIDAIARVADHFLKASPNGVFEIKPGEDMNLEGRVAMGELSAEQATHAAIVAGQLEGMTAEEAKQATWTVLGSNRTETLEGVRRSVSTIFSGGNVLTAVEEPVEGRIKAGLKSGSYTKDSLTQWVQMAEQATGEKFLPAEGDISDRALIEGISKIVVADVFGRRKDGSRIAPGAVTQGIKAVLQESAAARGLSAFLRAFRAFFSQVFKTARALAKARKEGKLSTDWEAHLDDLLGIESQQRHENEVWKEADAIANEVEYAGGPSWSEENPGPNGETWSLRPVDSTTKSGNLSPDELRDPAHLFKLLTGNDAGGIRQGSGAATQQRWKSRRKLASGEELARWVPVLDPERLLAAFHSGGTPKNSEDAQLLGVGGGEHSVILDPHAGQVIKLTKPGFFGYHAEDAGEYLQRWALANRMLKDVATIEGFVTFPGEDGPRLVVSQPFVSGRNSTAEEVADYLNSKGFHEFESNWVHPILGITIRDTQTAGNAITREDGSVMPIDWILEPTETADLRIVREQTGQGRETSFSLRPGNFQSRLDAVFSRFHATPEGRRLIAQEAKRRALKAGEEWIEKASVIRSAASIGKEARMREAMGYEVRMQEYLDGLTPEARQALEWEPADLADDPLVSAMLDHGKLMSRTTALQQEKLTLKNGDYDGAPWLPPSWYSKGAGIMPDQMAQAMHDAHHLPDAHTDTLWSELGKRIEASRRDKAAHKDAQDSYKVAKRYARDASRAEAEQWAEKAEKEAGSPKAQRDMLQGALRTLDGILAAAPPEVRAKVGGYVKIAGLATDEAMLQEVESRIEKLNVELERWLRKEGIAQIEELLKKGRPKTESGKKATGKDADMHHLFAAAAKAAEMDEAAVAGELARLDALIADGTLTPEQEILATTERGLVELIGDLYPRSVNKKRIYGGAESARIFAAIDALQDIYDGAWLKWKLKEIERKERRAGLRHEMILDTGKTGVKAERDAMDAESKTLLGKIKGGALSLSSFHEVLSYAFGAQSERVRSLVDAERTASGQYEDVNQALADEIEQFFAKLAGSSVLDGERLRYKLSQRTIKTAKGELSQLEALQALLMWRQEQGRQHMEGTRNENGDITSTWAYDQAWIDEIDAALSPEARRVLGWLTTKYGAEYATLNPLYRARFGVNLPGHDNYAPITVAPQQTKAGEVVDPVSGAAISSGSVLTPGSLRTRARNVVAEPQFRDALQVFLAHTRQLEYWKAYYDLATEANAILGNREVLNAVHANGGAEAAGALRKWVDAIAQGGFRDAAATLAVNDWLRNMSSNAATVALVGRVSTLLVQSTQLAAASVQMPTGAYIYRLGKLFTGLLPGVKGPNIWAEAWRSPFIQRRYKTAPPIVRQAMEGLADAKKPNVIKSWASSLGKLLSGADALFTGGTYAILLDYHRGTGRALGLSGAELEQWAHTEAERATEQVAQPTRMATRSLAEITNTNPLGKTAWAFASESRQKIALFAWSLAEWKTDPARALKTGLLVFGVGGLMTQILKNVWKELKGDDDEEKWSPERLVAASFAGPLQGIPGMSEAMGEPGLLGGLSWARYSFKDLMKGEADAKDIENLMSAAGYFNDTAAGIASLAHLGFDFAKLLTNALED